MTTKVAGEAVLGPVEGEGETAVGTAADMTALLAEQGGGVTASVQEKDGLLTGLKSFGDGHLQRCGKPPLGFGPFSLKPEIHHPDQGHELSIRALGKLEQGILSIPDVAITLHPVSYTHLTLPTIYSV